MKALQLSSTIILMLIIGTAVTAQEQRGVTVAFTVSNGQGMSQHLFLGIMEGATRGIDPSFMESELPPTPPNEIFDTRVISTPAKSDLGLGSLSDFRPVASTSDPFTEVYTIAYQAGVGASSVVIGWATPLPARVTKMLIDGQDVTPMDEVTTSFAQGQATVEITYNYKPLRFEANPVELFLDASNRQPPPSTTVEITPVGDSQAGWSIQKDANWLDVLPQSGTGKQTVTVRVNTSLLPAGTYNTTLEVRSPVYPARLDIPVTLRMTVGISEVSAPNGMNLKQNYPNPFGSATGSASTATWIELELGQRDISEQVSLKVFDIFGREVADLSPLIKQVPGGQILRYAPQNLVSGIYTYRLRQGRYILARSMVILSRP
ncbi:MAG: BACON domain-containing protein [Chlorobi bacterium]|nr:BACON domain-containing protein [Chlorobiota bacterium]